MIKKRKLNNSKKFKKTKKIAKSKNFTKSKNYSKIILWTLIFIVIFLEILYLLGVFSFGETPLMSAITLNNVNPASGAIDISLTPTLSWDAVPNAVKYDVYFGTISSPGYKTSVATNSYAPTGLSVNNIYYWKIAPRDANNVVIGTSDIYNFKTVVTNIVYPKLNITKIGTGSGTVTTADGKINCGSTCIAEYNSVANSVTLTATPSSGSVFVGWSGNGCLTTPTSPTCSISSIGNMVRNITANFGLPLPTEQASLPSPADSAINIPISGTLSWKSTSDADSYDLYFGKTNPPAFVASVPKTSTTTTYSYSSLTSNTKYYWKVSPRNVGGIIQGNVWSFTTSAPVIAAPTQSPTGYSPANNAVDVQWNTTFYQVYLSWLTTSDADSYDVYFGATNPPAFVANVLKTVYLTKYKINELLSPSTTYYWKVNPKNAGGVLQSTNILKFTTTTLARATFPVAILKKGSGKGLVEGEPAGLICGSTCSSTTYNYNNGATITLTANPSAGSVFDGWGKDCSGTSTTCTLTVDSSKSIDATFNSQGTTTQQIPCTRGNPIMSLTPLSSNTQIGIPIDYKLSIKNGDSGCGISLFSVARTFPANVSLTNGVSDVLMGLDSGENVNLTYNINSSSLGEYALVFNLTSNYSLHLIQGAKAIFNVTNCKVNHCGSAGDCSCGNGEVCGSAGTCVVDSSVSRGQTFSATQTQLASGIIKVLNEEDRIIMPIQDNEVIGYHTLDVESISDEEVSITISSDPINLNLTVGEERKLSLTSPDYYDLYVKLNGITTTNKANLTIQSINELVNPVPGQTGGEQTSGGEQTGTSGTGGEQDKNVVSGEVKEGIPFWYYIVGGIVVVGLIILIILIFKPKKKAIDGYSSWQPPSQQFNQQPRQPPQQPPQQFNQQQQTFPPQQPNQQQPRQF